MTTLTGTSTRTITGYLVTLLEYPRWLIEREVDFTNCHLHGNFDGDDDTCTHCGFGRACQWLNSQRDAPTVETPLPDLVVAVQAAVEYLRSEHGDTATHAPQCDCDTCHWLREAAGFLRTHRHRT